MQKTENAEKAVTTTRPSGQTPENTEKTATNASPPGNDPRAPKKQPPVTKTPARAGNVFAARPLAFAHLGAAGI
jgi:hypothetical protein